MNSFSHFLSIPPLKFTLLLSSFMCFANLLSAGVIIVMNSNDSGAESLRQAVIDAPSGDTITFDAITNGNTIQLTNDIIIRRDITIIGNDTTNTILDGMTNSRIFDVESSANVIVHGLTIQNGGMGTSGGGGIRNRGKLILRDCLIQNNGGASVSQGGGISNEGVLNVSYCTLQNNKADLFISSSRGGAIYHIGDSLIIERSNIVDNAASRTGSGIHSGSNMATVVKIDSSVIANNSISSFGTTGGIITGGGIYNEENSIMLITQSTVSNNSITASENSQSTRGGGIYNQGELRLTGCVVSQNTTHSEKSFTRGGGIYNRNMLDLDSTHIASNTSSSNSISAGSLNSPNASGGGIYNGQNASKLYCRNSTIKGNIILSLNGRGQGAGIRTEFGTGALINSVISGNFIQAPTAEGIGIYVRSNQSLKLTNVTISGNRADSPATSGGGLYARGTTVDIVNTIIAKNVDNGTGPDILNNGSTINDVGHNHIMGPNGGHGITSGNNIDPLFVMDVDTMTTTASVSGDLRLTCGSSGVNSGTADTIGLNLGLVDLGGLPRIQGSAIDIGAYEKTLPCTELSDCSQTNIDLDAILQLNSDPLSLFHAQLQLKSDVLLSRDMNLMAGQMILLEQNFTVGQGMELEAMIADCPK